MRITRYISILIAAIALFGCKQSELCYNFPNYLKTVVEVDLSQTQYTFEGDLYSYNVIFYPIDDGIMPLEDLEPQSFRMQKASDFEISIKPGDYNVLVYSDYSGQNAFYETDDFSSIYCEAYSQATLAGGAKSETGLTYAAEPDPIVVDHIEGLTIIDSGYGEGYSGQVVTFEAKQITTTIRAKVWLTNPRSIVSYSGHLGDVDSRYYITQDRSNHGGYAIAYTTDNSGIVSMSTNSNGESIGYLTLNIDMFGFTQSDSTRAGAGELNNINAGDAFIYLKIELPAESNTQTEFTFDISSYLNEMLRGEESDLEIAIGTADAPLVDLPELIYDGGDDDDSGFDVTVGDWDDEQDFVLDFGNNTIY